MNITRIGDRYIVYDDTVQNIIKLDNAIYKIAVNKMYDIHLVKYSGRFFNSEKIFGNYGNKVDKAFKLFNDRDKNLGILMTGKKGMGKSFCSKDLCNKCLDHGYPVILIDSSFDYDEVSPKEIPEFFGKIKQDVVVFFDEFDKVFCSYTSDEGNNKIDPQEDLLSMFDGVDSEFKRLFIVTANKLDGINEYFLNRPGRFHYHFKFTFPSENEIKDYINYYCKDLSEKELNSVLLYSSIHPLTYDCLNAIVTEFNYGRSFKEFINDLNISSNNEEFMFSYTFVFGVLHYSLDLDYVDISDPRYFNKIIEIISGGEKGRQFKDRLEDNKNQVYIWENELSLAEGNHMLLKPLTSYKVPGKESIFRIPISKDAIENIDPTVHSDPMVKRSICPIEKEDILTYLVS